MVDDDDDDGGGVVGVIVVVIVRSYGVFRRHRFKSHRHDHHIIAKLNRWGKQKQRRV